MPSAWTCPLCHVLNLAAATICDACGSDRPDRMPTTPTREAADRRCSWIGEGRRCELLATLGTHAIFCTWHALVMTSRGLGVDREAFERWCDRLREQHYCCTWTHYSRPALWAALTGRAPLSDPPAACEQSACPHGHALEIRP